MSGCSPRVDLAKKGATAPLPEPYWWRFLVGRLPDQGLRAEPGHVRQMQTLRHLLRPKMEAEGDEERRDWLTGHGVTVPLACV